MVDFEHFFVSIRQRVIQDLGDNFHPLLLEELSLQLNYRKRFHNSSSDQYRGKAAKVPAYYNPNSHVIHLNLEVLEKASRDLVENIYYHELLHAASHHSRVRYQNLDVLKSGLKIQTWDDSDRHTTLHRGFNEGLTQYLANCYTKGGPAYKHEVRLVGKLTRKIGLAELKAAYFGPRIDLLNRKVAVGLGRNFLHELSSLLDKKRYEEAETLLA